MTDPFSRPSLEDLRRILDSIDRDPDVNQRNAERLELSVPAEITTMRGNTVSAMTREISRNGIGLLHKGCLDVGEVTIRMASDSREFEYRVLMEWCVPTESGMFLSGGRFLARTNK